MKRRTMSITTSRQEDKRRLLSICAASTDEVAQELGGFNENEYIFIDRGSPVLGVAHLDTVLDYNRGLFLEGDVAHMMFDDIIMSPALDDRAGVFILTHLLPKMGIEIDVLLTNYEEVCQSTVLSFTPPRQYNWVVEFDKSGQCVSLYRYGNSKAEKYIKKVGMKIVPGSYTDIVDLDIDAFCMNWGCAYYNQHSEYCYLEYSVLEDCVDKFYAFYRRYKDEHLENEYEDIGHISIGGKILPWLDDNRSSWLDDDGLPWLDDNTSSNEEEEIDVCDTCGVWYPVGELFVDEYSYCFCRECSIGVRDLKPYKEVFGWLSEE